MFGLGLVEILILVLIFAFFYSIRSLWRNKPFSRKRLRVNPTTTSNAQKNSTRSNDELFPHNTTPPQKIKKEEATQLRRSRKKSKYQKLEALTQLVTRQKSRIWDFLRIHQLTMPHKFRNGYQGIVRNAMRGQKQGNNKNSQKSFISFRLETLDDSGKTYVVEIISKNIDQYNITNGDEVVVNGKINNQGILKATGIYLINTNTIYKISSGFTDGFFLNFLEIIFFFLAVASPIVGVYGGGIAGLGLGIVGLIFFYSIATSMSKI